MRGRKLKIAFNIDHFRPDKGGAERYLIDLVTFLLDNGHEVHVFAMDGEQTIQHERFTFHRVGVLTWFRWLRSLCFVIKSSKMIGAHCFDIVQVLGKNLTMDIFQPHGGSHRASFRQNIIASGESKITRLFYAFFRLLDPKQVLFFVIEWLQFHRKPLPEILIISKMIGNDLKRYYRVPDEKMHLIYNGVDLSRFSLECRRRYRCDTRGLLGVEKTQKLLFFVGHNFKLKGLRYFLEAVKIVADKKGTNTLRACVVGSGNKKRFEKYATGLGVKECCIFSPSVANIEQYYAAADVLVQPTFYDPCSLAVLEALACGVPVVTTRFNGAGELIEQGETGVVVDNPRDSNAIAQGILHFIEADAEIVAMRASASMNLYGIDKIFQRILDFYKSEL